MRFQECSASDEPVLVSMLNDYLFCSRRAEGGLEGLQEAADVAVAAVEDVFDLAGGAAIDHAQMQIDSELKVVAAQVSDAEAARPLSGLDRLLKLVNGPQ